MAPHDGNEQRDERGRQALRDLIEARIAEWERNITNLGHRVAKARPDDEVAAKMEEMKARLPMLAERMNGVMDVSEKDWSGFKSEVDLLLEDLIWRQNYVMRRIGAS